MCVITEKLKERFCKDLNLPIKIYKEPYFQERLELYNRQYNCLEKYNDFVTLVNECGSEQNYFELYNKVKDDAISYLNENPYMVYFAKEEDFSKFSITNQNFPKRDIYHHDNDGKCFISFDMKKGNFTALKNYDARIVNNADKYEDFLGFFTKSSHLLYSKYIRQVIFGNVNPRRQVTYEQFLMDKVLTDVLNYFPKESIVFFSTDEIVVEVEKEKLNENLEIANKIEQNAKMQNIDIRAEIFILHKIGGIDGYIKRFMYNEEEIDIERHKVRKTKGYIKEFLNGKKELEIKGVNSIMMPLVLRALYNEEITENDKVFLYEGMIVKLIDIPHITIPLDIKGEN